MRYILVVLMIVSANAFSHSGRTDSFGGHNNHKTGGYHYHNAGHSGYINSSFNNNYTENTSSYINVNSYTSSHSMPVAVSNFERMFKEAHHQYSNSFWSHIDPSDNVLKFDRALFSSIAIKFGDAFYYAIMHKSEFYGWENHYINQEHVAIAIDALTQFMKSSLKINRQNEHYSQFEKALIQSVESIYPLGKDGAEANYRMAKFMEAIGNYVEANKYCFNAILISESKPEQLKGIEQKVREDWIKLSEKAAKQLR